MKGLVLYLLVILAIDIAIAAAVGSAARRKGRSYGAWFVMAFFMPVPVAVVLGLVQDRNAAPVATVIYQQPPRAVDVPRAPCPRCGELIPQAAQMCRFCSLEIQPQGRTQLADGVPRDTPAIAPRESCPRCSTFLSGPTCTNCGYRAKGALPIAAKPSTSTRATRVGRKAAAPGAPSATGEYSCHFAGCNNRTVTVYETRWAYCGQETYPVAASSH